MKVNALKNLIKEAVKEAIREELNTDRVDVVKTNENKPSNFSKDKGLNEMLSQTRNNMTKEEFSNIMSFDSSQAQGFPAIKQMSAPSSPTIPTGPQPGIDISKLDFVKNAADVYNLSVEKDRNKLG